MRFRTTAGVLAAGLSAGESGARAVGLVRIKVDGGSVVVAGADGEVGVVLHLRAEGVEDGEIVVPPKPVIAYSQTLDPDQTIEVSTEGMSLIVTGDGRVYRFTGSGTRTIEIESPGDGSHQARAEGMGEMLAMVRHAVDPRSNLIKLSCRDGLMRMDATDAYRIASVQVPGRDGDTWSALFPIGGLQLALKWHPEELAIDPKGRVASFRGGGVETTIRLAAAEFPSVETVIEKKGAVRWTLRRDEAVRALKRIASVAGSEALRCEVREGEMCIKVSSGEGSGTEYITTGGEGEGWFGISARNLLDALSAAGEESVELCYQDPRRAVHLCAGGGTFVIMPVVWSTNNE